MDFPSWRIQRFFRPSENKPELLVSRRLDRLEAVVKYLSCVALYLCVRDRISAKAEGRLLRHSHDGFKRASILRDGLRQSSHVKRLIARNVFLKEFIDKDRLIEERELKRTRWIEYRYMNPLQCTQMFTELYEKEVRNFHGRYFDYATVDDLKPIRKEYAKNGGREMSQLWRAIRRFTWLDCLSPSLKMLARLNPSCKCFPFGLAINSPHRHN